MIEGNGATYHFLRATVMLSIIYLSTSYTLRDFQEGLCFIYPWCLECCLANSKHPLVNELMKALFQDAAQNSAQKNTDSFAYPIFLTFLTIVHIYQDQLGTLGA